MAIKSKIRTCGNKNCKCIREGKKHKSYYLYYKVGGKTRAVYIPVDLEDEVREWSNNYKKLKKIIFEISRTGREIIRRYVTEKKLKKGRQ